MLGPFHPQTVNVMNCLCAVFQKQGQSERLEAMHRRLLITIQNLRDFLFEEGKYEEQEILEFLNTISNQSDFLPGHG